MMELTTRQSDLLYEITELHMQWYSIYYDQPPTFEVLLELNHRKLSYKITPKCPKKDIIEILFKMRSEKIWKNKTEKKKKLGNN